MSVQIFVIDGPDGVGKTTIINNLVSYFNQSTSYRVISYSNSKTEFGKDIYNILFKHDLPIEVEKQLQLSTLQYLASYINGTYIIPDLLDASDRETKTLIFLDRWVSSLGIYQGYAHRRLHGEVKPLPLSFEKTVIDDNIVNYFILDLDDSILKRRLLQRDKSDKYESTNFQHYVREGFRALKKYNIPKTTHVSISENLDENTKLLLSKIIQLLK